jgi:hypothetical protein
MPPEFHVGAMVRDRWGCEGIIIAHSGTALRAVWHDRLGSFRSTVFFSEIELFDVIDE